ncbi:MAG TPA: hypothetical protein VHS78_04265 [Candidatus Elarobacter sp.]|jgi:hypothetical protein|nr:hypothetical protein [Candidatus Elarobacter sp.]
MDVLLVHGYSETSLGAYFTLPQRIQTALPGTRVAVAAFNSLDDTITIDDLADAMELRLEAMESRAAWNTAASAVICHSTGALVTRRWILNRLAVGKPIPSHLITMAGANHGSTLAALGKSPLGYVQKLLSKHLLTVGASVLTDLEYGSDFLLRVNGEWLDRSIDGSLGALWQFSMGGDSIGADATLQLLWPTHEPGSDNTVRISGANLNYTFIDASHGPGRQPAVTARRPPRPVPHLVLEGYSHFGGASGIIGFVDPAGDRALDAVVAALRVRDAASYANVQTAWAATTAQWMTAKRAERAGAAASLSQINSTLLFDVRDESGRTIDDCMIVMLDKSQLPVAAHASVGEGASALSVLNAANAVSPAILPHSPIHNDANRGAYSFYMDYDEYLNSSPHWFHVEAAVPTQLLSFVPLTFTQPANLQHAIGENEFTYARLTMSRAVDQIYAAYHTPFDPNTTWQPMPFPPAGQIP